MHLLDLTLKIHSGISNSISAKLQCITTRRGGQAIVDFDAADNCRLNATTIKAMNFQEDIPSFWKDIFKIHCVPLFDLNSMQDASQYCPNRELVGEPLRLELNVTFPLEHATELISLGVRMSSVAVVKFGVVGRNI